MRRWEVDGTGTTSEKENWGGEHAGSYFFILYPRPKELEMKVRSKGFEHRKRRGQATFEMQVQEQRSLREHRHGCGRKWKSGDKGIS